MDPDEQALETVGSADLADLLVKEIAESCAKSDAKAPAAIVRTLDRERRLGHEDLARYLQELASSLMSSRVAVLLAVGAHSKKGLSPLQSQVLATLRSGYRKQWDFPERLPEQDRLDVVIGWLEGLEWPEEEGSAAEEAEAPPPRDPAAVGQSEAKAAETEDASPQEPVPADKAVGKATEAEPPPTQDTVPTERSGRNSDPGTQRAQGPGIAECLRGGFVCLVAEPDYRVIRQGLPCLLESYLGAVRRSEGKKKPAERSREIELDYGLAKKIAGRIKDARPSHSKLKDFVDCFQPLASLCHTQRMSLARASERYDDLHHRHADLQLEVERLQERVKELQQEATALQEREAEMRQQLEETVASEAQRREGLVAHWEREVASRLSKQANSIKGTFSRELSEVLLCLDRPDPNAAVALTRVKRMAEHLERLTHAK